jgi:hypothetical protein
MNELVHDARNMELDARALIATRGEPFDSQTEPSPPETQPFR